MNEHKRGEGGAARGEQGPGQEGQWKEPELYSKGDGSHRAQMIVFVFSRDYCGYGVEDKCGKVRKGSKEDLWNIFNLRNKK